MICAACITAKWWQSRVHPCKPSTLCACGFTTFTLPHQLTVCLPVQRHCVKDRQLMFHWKIVSNAAIVTVCSLKHQLLWIPALSPNWAEFVVLLYVLQLCLLKIKITNQRSFITVFGCCCKGWGRCGITMCARSCPCTSAAVRRLLGSFYLSAYGLEGLTPTVMAIFGWNTQRIFSQFLLNLGSAPLLDSRQHSLSCPFSFLLYLSFCSNAEQQWVQPALGVMGNKTFMRLLKHHLFHCSMFSTLLINLAASASPCFSQ